MISVLRKDLFVLVADRAMEAAFGPLLLRRQALRVRSFTFDIYPHPQHDPGCCVKSEQFLRPFINQYDHALVVFDRAGCGLEPSAPDDIESQVEDRLGRNGWSGRAKALAIDPELEVWVWSDSPHVDDILGWQARTPSLRTWLLTEGYVTDSTSKPTEPKAAFTRALRLAQKPQSVSIFGRLAERVSFGTCTDRAFLKLTDVLRTWFPLQEPEPAMPLHCREGDLFDAGRDESERMQTKG